MRNWILSLARDDMERCISIGVFGLKRKYLLGKVSSGDHVACYVTKDRKIIALGTVTNGYYMDDTDVFLKEGTFPDRIDFEAEQLEPEFYLMEIIDRLSFITNIAYWSAYFRNGIVEITDEDWDLIEKCASKTRNKEKTK